MRVRCAACESHVCRGGVRDAGPDHCPMHDPFPGLEELYADSDALELLRLSTLIEARGYGRWHRLRELAELASLAQRHRLGIAHGPDTVEEAREVAEYLKLRGLDPVLPDPRDWRDPQAQGLGFRGEGTKLNVVAGLGVAAEALFHKASHAPSTVLIARDVRLGHNPAAALYTSRSYLQDALHGHWPREERKEASHGASVLSAMAASESGEGREPPPTRLEEAMTVAQALGTDRLGITFCVGFKDEAHTLARILEINGFEVFSACCKTGATPKEDIGIPDEEKIRPGRPEMICNPIAQAELLNRAGVQMALVLGQCVGHDAATLGHLDAPGVCLVVKDRVLAHNPVAALR